ncbi:MAG: hypothetical protein F6J95_023450 [Leptolyngbya sp. SIO1E4]|nr:hypothetical protein [Leptolyngbya sp. SIO1E4]
MSDFVEQSNAEWADIWQRFEEVAARVDGYDQPKEDPMFLVIQGGECVINLSQISDIDVCDGCWEVSMASGNCLTVEEEDLEALRAKLGL